MPELHDSAEKVRLHVCFQVLQEITSARVNPPVKCRTRGEPTQVHRRALKADGMGEQNAIPVQVLRRHTYIPFT